VSGSATQLYYRDVYGAAQTGNFTLPVRLSIAYPDADDDGYVDGTTPRIDINLLKLFTLNTTGSAWQLVDSSILDKTGKLVYADIRHFSIYGLVSYAPVAANLKQVFAYPNPYKPGSGGDFDRSVFGEGIVFEGLTARAKVQIFTIAGDLVATVEEENGDGRAVWNARTGDGSPVASGLYIYLVKNADKSSDKNSGKITIIK
jgi:hypothetical protein